MLLCRLLAASKPAGLRSSDDVTPPSKLWVQTVTGPKAIGLPAWV